jgi:hypothetical protein
LYAEGRSTGLARFDGTNAMSRQPLQQLSGLEGLARALGAFEGDEQKVQSAFEMRTRR